jgi:tetratricopeptide (TPR) repeat protein
MAKHGKRPGKDHAAGDRQRGREERRDALRVRPVPGRPGEIELVEPPSARQRREDLEEVRAMLDGGEIDVAVDELLWLLSGCDILLEAHKLLGEIALADSDLQRARGHLGRAYELGLGALEKRSGKVLPYARPANQPFFEAGKGLAWCLKQEGETALALDVVERLLTLDPSGPLGLNELREELRGQASRGSESDGS